MSMNRSQISMLLNIPKLRILLAALDASDRAAGWTPKEIISRTALRLALQLKLDTLTERT